MTKKKTLKDEMLKELKKIIKKNPDFDYQHREMKSKKVLNDLKWSSKTKSEDDMLLVLRAYQRIVRITPKENLDKAILLLEQGFHSALQIASMSQKEFIKKTEAIFNGEKTLAETIYKTAMAKRNKLVIQYMNIKQNSEPHAKAARI